MSDKSPRQSKSVKSAKSIKVKRAGKRTKAAGKEQFAETFHSTKKR